MNRFIESIMGRARSRPARIVFPEGLEPRILKAVCYAAGEGIVNPVLLGTRDEIITAAAGLECDPGLLQIIDPSTSDLLDKYAAEYRSVRGSSEAIARRAVSRPLFFAGMMTRMGDAEGMIAGAITLTATVIRAGMATVGMKEGVTRPSSFMIVALPEHVSLDRRIFIFTDVSVNIKPASEELAAIAVETAGNVENLLGIEPRIAFLSFSTHGSARHVDVDRVTTAVEAARRLAPDLVIDGELQLDAAIVPGIAVRKAPESVIAGSANILVFPDLNAANIGYKLVEYMGGAHAFGPVFQGFNKPVNDLSRGASVDDIVGLIAVTAIQAAALQG
jgi:phosphate acetyltransferase